MKNSFGNNVILTLFGESHGKCIGGILDGMEPGLKVDTDNIRKLLVKRRSSAIISTKRREDDSFSFLSGVKNGLTEGTPICITIDNNDVSKNNYVNIQDLLRPSHADYTAYCKYHGFEDKNGGGHFSGRLTAPIVALGSIALDSLKEVGIFIGTHINSIGYIKDRSFSDYIFDIELLDSKSISVLDDDVEKQMTDFISKVKTNGDSVGGVTETAVFGLPDGIGEPWFDSIESMISHAIFSIPAVKGVEFGLGFGFDGKHGSNVNDFFTTKCGKIITKTNNNGGINGGISNGMPIVFKTAFKPTPSISIQQESVNIKKMQDETIVINGRHDPAIVHRACPVIDCLTAICLCDMLSTRYGNDFITAVKRSKL